jgi:nicotinate phosphoribosyltransferase
VVEFGSRRAHSPEAGVLAGRAAYIGGCSGTSNAQAGKLFGVPVFGTAAHSWTMSFAREEDSFRALQSLLREHTVFLLDTYSTLEGARLAAKLGGPLWGVRLDSGDLLELSREVRRMLDAAGLNDAKIFATSDLDEYRLAELMDAGAPLDAFGVGTRLATSADAPTLSAVYKLVELRRGKTLFYAAKFSDEKSTLPGAKQVYRFQDHDVVALASECNDPYKGEPLVRPVLMGGKLVEPLPATEQIRNWAQQAMEKLPADLRSLHPAPPYRVTFSTELQELAGNLRRQHQLVTF